MQKNCQHCDQIDTAVEKEITARKRGEKMGQKHEHAQESGIDFAIKKNISLVLLGILALSVMGVNLSMQFGMQDRMDKLQNNISLMAISGTNSPAPKGNDGTAPAFGAQQADMTALFAEVIPKGVPEIYGSELGVSFETPVESMKVLSNLDGDLFPNGKLKVAQLSAAQKERYIKIGTSIACEFCCGATTLVAKDGQPACGCAHSAAMRGLAMYLLTNHGDEMSDGQIIAELSKWKTMFFPKQMMQKAIELKAQSGEISPQSLNQLPEMVGGC